jgi:hypothetical protein
MKEFIVGVVVGVLFGVALGTAEGGDVNVNIGVPPVIVSTPDLELVPGTYVYRAPHLEFNVFLFGDRYYSRHNDAWYVAPRAGARWTRVAVAAVPVEVRAVPVQYYKIKPKYAKKLKHDGDAGRRGCPPGLAQQGRC